MFIFKEELAEGESTLAIVILILVIIYLLLPITAFIHKFSREVFRHDTMEYRKHSITFLSDYDRANPMSSKEANEKYLEKIAEAGTLDKEQAEKQKQAFAQGGRFGGIMNYGAVNFGMQYRATANYGGAGFQARPAYAGYQMAGGYRGFAMQGAARMGGQVANFGQITANYAPNRYAHRAVAGFGGQAMQMAGFARPQPVVMRAQQPGAVAYQQPARVAYQQPAGTQQMAYQQPAQQVAYQQPAQRVVYQQPAGTQQMAYAQPQQVAYRAPAQATATASQVAYQPR